MKIQLDKLLNTISLLTVFGSFIFSLFVAYWLIYPYKPLVVNGDAQVLQDKVKAGDSLIYRLDFCKNMDLPVTIRRRFVDGLVYTLPEFTTHNNKIGCKVQDILLEVPETLPDGEYFFYTEFVYKVNPIRSVIVEVESNSFRVIGGDSK
jgi:hypothetical protein